METNDLNSQEYIDQVEQLKKEYLGLPGVAPEVSYLSSLVKNAGTGLELSGDMLDMSLRYSSNLMTAYSDYCKDNDLRRIRPNIRGTLEDYLHIIQSPTRRKRMRTTGEKTINQFNTFLKEVYALDPETPFLRKDD
jgi:hypothetical protein